MLDVMKEFGLRRAQLIRCLSGAYQVLMKCLGGSQQIYKAKQGAVAAMATATAYEAKRKQKAEQVAHLAIAERNAKKKGKKDTTPMWMIRWIELVETAKAYQASLDSFKSRLIDQWI